MSWLRSYLLLLRWNALSQRVMLPLMLVVQALLAVGIVVGFAFLVPDLDDSTALHLATGAPTVGLLTVGLVLAPQAVARAKTEGTFEYMRAFPVPRLAHLLADLTVWLGTALPGLALAQAVAVWRFDLDYDVSPLIVLAVLLVALTATAVGYGIAYVTPPTATTLITQVVVFAVLLFSPVTFPAERLPDWLAAAHEVLPVASMAEILRTTLVTPPEGLPATPFLVVAAWGAAGFAVTYSVMVRRR